MNKFIFTVYKDNGHLHSIISRKSDGAQKYFFQCGGSKEGLENFFSNITDQIAEGYFPKKKDEVDNWEYLGNNPDRKIAEDEAKLSLTKALLS